MHLSAIIKIIRPVNLIITFFSVVIASVISASFNQINLDVILIALSVTFSFAAGNVINDVIDYEIDKINRPERVLPQGLLSLTSAKIIYITSVVISLVLAALVSVNLLVILIALNLMLLAYSTHFKRVILFSNFIVAFATAFPLIIGGMVVNNFDGGLIPAGFAFLTNFIREIIKDVEDIKGDSTKGVTTFPQKVGSLQALNFVLIMIILTMVLDTLPFLYGFYNIEYFMLIMVLINPIFVYAIKILITQKDSAALRKLSSIIKLNMILGLIAILIGAQ